MAQAWRPPPSTNTGAPFAKNENKKFRKLLDYQSLRVCKRNCSNCIGCILTLLTCYRFQCRSYNEPYKNVSEMRLLYYALWYPAKVLFQIQILKSRLRSLIGEELLESLLLCSVEFDLLKAIDNDTVYRNFH